MGELLSYCLTAFLPPFLLRLLSAMLPARLR